MIYLVSVPMAVLNNDLSESSEDDESSPILDDDITTRGLARLSSAATCLVAGVEYTHGQQVFYFNYSIMLQISFIGLR